MGYVLDSTFVVDLLRSDPEAERKAKWLDARKEPKLLSAPVVYEVAAGFLFARSRSETAMFRRMASRYPVVPFDEASALKAADIRAELLRLGRVKSHVDTMIAGIAAAGGHVLVSRDRDFEAISASVDLDLESY